MSKRLYVGNLSYNLRSEEVEQIFREVGEVVSAKVMMDRETGRSKGFAFVEMATEELGKLAIQKLNEKEVSGRNMRVTEANPRSERPEGGNRFGGQREGGFRNRR